MVTLKEICGKYKFNEIDPKHQANLLILLEKVNKIRSLYNSPMTPSSGYRSPDDQIRIYRDIAQKKGQVFDITKVPMKSKHLVGLAVDFADPDKKLQKWCLDHLKELEEIGVWIESFDATSGKSPWVHFQVVQYGSWKPGKSIFFNP